MNHYFISDPQLKHDEAVFTLSFGGVTCTFHTDSGVFSKEHLDTGSALLIKSVPVLPQTAVDLGCGWGPIGILLAKINPHCRFTLLDVNERAVALAKRNIAENEVANATALQSDGLSAQDVPVGAVISNPPIRIGKQAMYALFRQAKEKLLPGGYLCIVIRKAQGAPSCKAYLTELFGNCETVARQSGFHILLSYKA